MLEDGLSFPLRGDRAIGRLLVGGLLGFFSFLVIPGIVVFGYLVRVLAAAARDEREPPAFDDWGGLVADGLRGIVVAIIYSILPVGLLILAIGFVGAGLAVGEGSDAGLLGSLGALGVLTSLLVILVIYYLIPAAITNMALEGDIAAAFDVGTLRPVLLSLEYFVAWLLPVVIAFITGIVSFFVVVFTLGLGVLVLPFIQFYVQVSVFYMFGRAFGSVIEAGEDGGSAAAAPR